ncbi:response regulator transcription factor [Synechococcus sp. Cruz-9H2]|uniref:response regulator transcription factor n=1 Tax=unclassified Synechococcus TaxID=2626047 RepID=UPI0020CCCC15|nr:MULTISPECIES: response regulator transcription factor [unclassified Synechococcus]MCP9820350.1 response regulator transcription factor [Synechococcus sp. Cruz-9H2]MCP9844658.1 response regulator transcription factor [Synechococcus sp. Edmonson 11F2]MCP9856780.1 response regulator transcription factor [Synechococcus sp. Cruz-9C9]MCP9864010.1 response regulator transcription factor [Synechococcus sp. Cruz-7E5]MCP9871205.1 response regulator transcription factor [Synechococcus sp. Cruz-7B9]
MTPQPQPQPNVLIVDDDPELRRFLAGELKADGYGVESAGTGQEALTRIRGGEWDLVLLDWTLPDFSGVEVCRRMRASGLDTPVLMLTARDAVSERVEALDAGADDYLTKPFSIEELLARVRARLRRDGRSGGGSAEMLSLNGLLVNTASHEVSRDGQPIQLTVREYDLLLCLLRQPNRVHERNAILREVWGETFVGDDNLLDVYIRYLRKKVEAPGQPTLIQTVRGVGFMLKEGAVKA